VAEARKLPVERVHEIAQGRVWDGGTARQIGLVDQFGGLDEAIAEAAKRAQIDVGDARPVFLEAEADWLTQLFGGMTTARATISPDPFGRLAQRPEALLHRALNEASGLLRGNSIQARCLECPAPYDLAPTSGVSAGWWQALVGQLAR
jgi:protease-4